MTQVTNIPYDDLQVGQKASFSSSVEERDVQLFAAVSRDHNPVHLDAEFAAKTMFKERIAHGMFSGALISAAVKLGALCAGPCPAALEQYAQVRAMPTSPLQFALNIATGLGLGAAGGHVGLGKFIGFGAISTAIPSPRNDTGKYKLIGDGEGSRDFSGD